MGLSMGINRPKQIIGQATGPTIWTGSYSYITPATAAPPNMGEIVHGDNVLSQMLFAKTDIDGVAYTGTKLAIGDILVIGGTQYVLDSAPVEYPTYYGVYIEPETQKQEGVYPVTVYAGGAQPPAFNPIDLFAAGEQGAWYDPSDLSTMFQDSAGTTPVTADGQPVGLILDKSKGLVLGAEAAPSLSSSAGWTASSGITVSGGTATFSAVSNGGALAIATPPLTVGKTYISTVVVATLTSGQLSVYVGGTYMSNITAPGTYTYRVNATTNGLWNIGAAQTPTNCTITSISVKEIAGNHASQATAAKRPLFAATGLAEWTNYDAVDDVLNNTFPSSLGSSCTVAKAVVGGSPTILTGQTIGTTWAESTDNAGLVIVDRALTPQETTDLTAWLTAKGATA